MADHHDLRRTYDRIAEHFSATREYAWPEIEAFVRDCPTGGIGIDVGCGNGRHAELLAERAGRVVGIDLSRGLLTEARERARDRGFRLELLQGDAAVLPVRSGSVDAAIYVATIHHLDDRNERLESLNELARVLAPEGRGLVSAWSTAHDRFEGVDRTSEEGFDTTVDWTLPGGETIPRFYHIYAPAEFKADLDASALATTSFEVSSGNCFATVRSRH